MTTRAEAVEYLESLGYYAKPRDWGFGETIMVISGAVKKDGLPMSYRKLVYLYPRDGLWSIYDASITQPVSDERRLALREACNAAAEILDK